ncbi:hypothetical protein ACFFJN_15810 [Erwinia mallotivora]|uniref:hypothetical protein n=1 Tax=Erwinia mallotivora TaxID=69222 RepID=UPI0035E4D71B
MNNKPAWALLAAVLTLTGCARTEPVRNINQTVSSQYSSEQIKNAILQAGMSRQWMMRVVGPGVITGQLAQRGHQANIRVTYGKGHYSIDYVGSDNLRADKGQIHRSYNRWVNNLDHDIRFYLSAQTGN